MTSIEILKNAIKEIKIVTGKDYKDNDNDTLHVAHSGTSNYLSHTGVTMTSILASNPNDSFCFHLFVNGISDKDKFRMKKLADEFHCKIELYLIDDTAFKGMLHRDGIAVS